MKIYTGTGDKGKTSLFSGERVAKSHERIEAYGDLDELNSVLGLVAAHLEGGEGRLTQEIREIQSLLLRTGAWLATTPGSAAQRQLPPLGEDLPRTLETAIDRMDAALAPLRGFLLPGGCPAAAMTHLARTVCRRAERHTIRLAGEGPPPAAAELAPVVIFLNRLSDYLFVLARYLNHRQGVADILWEK